MPRTPVSPKGAPPPLAPYSPGIRAGDFVFVSGILAMNAEGKTVGAGDIRVQTRQVLENVVAILEAAGASLEDVVYNTIFIKSLDDYVGMNEIYKEYFPTEPPGRYCVRADLVKEEFLVEIASTAYLGR